MNLILETYNTWDLLLEGDHVIALEVLRKGGQHSTLGTTSPSTHHLTLEARLQEQPLGHAHVGEGVEQVKQHGEERAGRVDSEGDPPQELLVKPLLEVLEDDQAKCEPR